MIVFSSLLREVRVNEDLFKWFTAKWCLCSHEVRLSFQQISTVHIRWPLIGFTDIFNPIKQGLYGFLCELHLCFASVLKISHQIKKTSSYSFLNNWLASLEKGPYLSTSQFSESDVKVCEFETSKPRQVNPEADLLASFDQYFLGGYEIYNFLSPYPKDATNL